MNEEKTISEAASEKRKRGRPRIDTSMVDDMDGTRRTKINNKYMFDGLELITKYEDEIIDKSALWLVNLEQRRATGKQGILEQIGRMLSDGFPEASCVNVANLSIYALKRGYTSREIENAIRQIRKWADISEADPQDSWAHDRAVRAVQILTDMAGVEWS